MRNAALISVFLLLAAGGALWLSRGAPEVAASGAAATGARASGASGSGHAHPDPSSFAARLAALRRAPAGPARAVAIVALLAAWAEQQPALAIDAAAALADEDGRGEALHECLPHFLSADPDAARSWLLEAARTLPVELVQALARDAAAHDPELGFSVALQLPVRARPAALKEVFSAWAARDARAAADATARLSRADGYLGAVEEVARVWGEQDAPAAFIWSARLPEVEARRTALLPLVDSWAVRAPQAAAASVASLPFEPWRRRLIDGVVAPWGQQDPESALGWVKGLTEPLEREAAATTLLTQLLPSAPARAAELALELGGGATSPLVDKVVAAWVARDAPAALAWASRSPRGAAREQDPEARQALLAGALARWQQQDPEAAQSWLHVHPGVRPEREQN
jgi:hypothetical protein